jgi:hypothetical protein
VLIVIAASKKVPSLRCSFCTKPEKQIAKLIAGPGIYICNECVDLCIEILETDTRQPAKGKTSSIPIWDSMTDDEILAHLPKIAEVSAQVDGSLQDWIDRLRQRGVTWAKIGAALEMTRQSAWERFSGEE